MSTLSTIPPAQWGGGSPTDNVVGRFQDEPIETPDIPPLWAEPEPPIVNMAPPVDPWFGYTWENPPPQRPPVGGPMPIREPNSRNPATGAPTWRPEEGNNPLPPSWNTQVAANGVHPITGAPNYTPARVPNGWWPPDRRPMPSGT